MELRSEIDHGALPEPDEDRARRRRGPGGVSDLISALHDDLLLLVLVGLRCTRTAVRTGLISRRWRGLWTGLTDLVFHDVSPATANAALVCFAASTPVAAVSTLDICFPNDTAALFSPAELVFNLHKSYVRIASFLPDIELPCFRRTKSIELDALFLRINPPPVGEFSALERLSLTGNIINLGVFISRCPRLRMLSVSFRGTESGSIEDALAALEAAAPGLEVSLIDICIYNRNCITAARVDSLLHSAARVSPQNFVFTVDVDARDYRGSTIHVDLPYFPRTTSIDMTLYNMCFKQLPTGEFPMLERLSISGRSILDLDTLVAHCPRLRVLRMAADNSTDNITVHSASLQELDVNAYMQCRGITLVTPMLKELKLRIYAHKDLSLSISAPMVKKVSLMRCYTEFPVFFGRWMPHNIKLETAPTNNGPPVHSLVLRLSAHSALGSELDFASEIEKLLVTGFSCLELHLSPFWHAFEPLVVSILGTRRIRTATQKLSIILSNLSEARKSCRDCPCGEPKNWRSRSISLLHLKDVEISGFKGEHCQLDLLKLIFRSAPTLKIITVRLACEINAKVLQDCIQKIYNIFLVHPSVKCSIYLSSGELVQLELLE